MRAPAELQRARAGAGRNRLGAVTDTAEGASKQAAARGGFIAGVERVLGILHTGAGGIPAWQDTGAGGGVGVGAGVGAEAGTVARSESAVVAIGTGVTGVVGVVVGMAVSGGRGVAIGSGAGAGCIFLAF